MDDDGRLGGEEIGTAPGREQQAGSAGVAQEPKLGEAWGDDIPLERQAELEVFF